MTELMIRILENKQQTRQRLAALSFSEKIAILEKLRERSLLIVASPLRRQADAIRKKPRP